MAYVFLKMINADDTYKQCYDSCLTCSKGGTSTDNNCDKCISNYHYIYNKTGQCISENNKPDDTYYDEKDDTYKKCYEKCSKCGSSGDDTNHNCISCISGYHWIYNQTAFCIKEGEQPEDTFYDEKDDTYKKCYERCAKCSKAGDLMDHNCDECAKDADGNYIYHFTIDKEKQCISETETEHDYYLNNETNTYEECHKNCYYCSKAGTDDSNNCNKCNTYYHFIYNKTGQCISENDKCTNCYLDESDDTYKLCYKTCGTCSAAGTDENPNCLKCASGYHFIYNRTNYCVKEGEQPENTYLDNDTDTYRKCYDSCSKCTTSGSTSCTQCAHGYHFIYNKKGYCIKEGEQPDNTYLDESDDTYKKCHSNCATCKTAGSDSSNNCVTCLSGYWRIFGDDVNCHSNIPENYYYEETCGCYKPCHNNCKTCSQAGTDDSNNCKKCINGYYFIYNKTGHCIPESAKPDDTYLDGDTFKKCYETCETCYGYGHAGYHNCKTCAKDTKGNYLYHFTYQYSTLCIPESEKPERSYLDETDNTYKPCYKYCLTCSKEGTEAANNCDKCITTRHFVYTQVTERNCILPSQAPNNTYLNTENDTYVKCHDNCYYCSKAGTDSSNNCDLCIDGYHFIYNQTGQCIKEGEQPTDTYLDNSTDTYRKCYETCATCFYAGSETYNYCLDCKKDSNGKYLRHFKKKKDYLCISESVSMYP